MENKTVQAKELAAEQVITPDELHNHWQGHRRLTRKVIEAFPEDKLFNYSVGGMRPFSELALEMITMTGPGIDGVVSGKWKGYENIKGPKTTKDILNLWDEVTEKIDRLWPQIPPHRFQENEVAFGQYEGTIISHIFYFIDNEIHHRAQGYVYLRSLGIEPPYFWDRE